MTFTRKDAAAAVLTALAVLVFLATHEGWNVWLVGGSPRWAAAVIAILGSATCAQGSPDDGFATKVCEALGGLALLLVLAALVFGSLTVLTLLVVDIVVLWAVSTLRHVMHAPRRPMTT
jgi:hypothetical protein